MTDWRHQKQNLPQFTVCGNNEPETYKDIQHTTEYIKTVNQKHHHPVIFYRDGVPVGLIT